VLIADATKFKGLAPLRCSRKRASSRSRRMPGDPWRANIDVTLRLIDDLDLQIAAMTVQLKRQGVDHRDIPLLVTAPGIGWVNAYTSASKIGDIGRFAWPPKLCGYTGLCPRVKQSGATDARGPISKHGPNTCAGRSSRPR
jgi:transposase